MVIINFLRIVICKILSIRRDFFRSYKYDSIKEYYGKVCADIGAGTGWFSKYLISRGHQTIPLDVVDRSEAGVNIKLFNGRKLPLLNKSVDTSLFLFVLHHTNSQIQLLREAIRVSRKYIVIGEDMVENRFDEMLGNIHLNTSPWAKGQDSFRSEKGWLKLFKKLKLRVVKIVKIPCEVYPVYPVHRRIFVLEVAK